LFVLLLLGFLFVSPPTPQAALKYAKVLSLSALAMIIFFVFLGEIFTVVIISRGLSVGLGFW